MIKRNSSLFLFDGGNLEFVSSVLVISELLQWNKKTRIKIVETNHFERLRQVSVVWVSQQRQTNCLTFFFLSSFFFLLSLLYSHGLQNLTGSFNLSFRERQKKELIQPPKFIPDFSHAAILCRFAHSISGIPSFLFLPFLPQTPFSTYAGPTCKFT